MSERDSATTHRPALPHGWIWVSRREIAELTGGLTKGQKRKSGDTVRSVPYLRVANVQRGYLDLDEVKQIEATEEEIEALKLRSGDLLFNEGGDRDKLGRGWIWRDEIPECIHQNHVFRGRLRSSEIDPRFVSWYANSAGQSYFMAEGKQTTNLASINLTKLGALPVPLAPAEEQRRIVAEIDKQFTQLDAGIAALKRVQANLKRYRASVLKAACEGRLVPTEAELARTEGRDYEPADKLLARILLERRARWEADQLAKMKAAGKVPRDDGWKHKYIEPITAQSSMDFLPEGWCWATVDQLACVGTGATPLRSRPAFYEAGAIPWVTSGALNEPYVSTATEFVTEQALSETNLTLYPPHTLLVAMYGEGKTRGKCSELLIAATTNQAVAALVLDGEAATVRSYLKLFLQASYEEMRRRGSGGVQPNINLGLVRRLLVPLPPKIEQERIIQEAAACLSVVSQTERNLANTLARSSRLRHTILKRAFCGQLVPQEPDGEPASTLLDRIQTTQQERVSAAHSRGRSQQRGTRRIVVRY